MSKINVGVFSDNHEDPGKFRVRRLFP